MDKRSGLYSQGSLNGHFWFLKIVAIKSPLAIKRPLSAVLMENNPIFVDVVVQLIFHYEKWIVVEKSFHLSPNIIG